MIRGVVFDIDGTLYDYEAANRKAERALFAYAAEALGLRDFASAYREGRGRTKRLAEGTAAQHSRLLYIQHALEQLCRNPIRDSLRLERVFWESFLDAMTLFDGVRALMERLRGHHIAIGVCTDLTAAIQMEKLDRLALSDFVDALVTSEETGREKPEAKNFRIILDKLGIQAEEALMVGDDYEKDIEGARKAGMKAAWFAKGGKDTAMAMDVRFGNYTDGKAEALCGIG